MANITIDETPTPIDLVVDQGDDFTILITRKDDSDALIDLTNYSYAGMARKEYPDASPAFSFVLTLQDQITNKGEVIAKITHASTSALDLSDNNKFVYDIEETNPSNDVKKIMKGKLTLYPEATK